MRRRLAILLFLLSMLLVSQTHAAVPSPSATYYGSREISAWGAYTILFNVDSTARRLTSAMATSPPGFNEPGGPAMYPSTVDVRFDACHRLGGVTEEHNLVGVPVRADGLIVYASRTNFPAFGNLEVFSFRGRFISSTELTGKLRDVTYRGRRGHRTVLCHTGSARHNYSVKITVSQRALQDVIDEVG